MFPGVEFGLVPATPARDDLRKGSGRSRARSSQGARPKVSRGTTRVLTRSTVVRSTATRLAARLVKQAKRRRQK